MDNSCSILGNYSPGPTCDVPWTIDDSFSQYELSITKVYMETDNEAFCEFKSANGAYFIGNNGCTCTNLGEKFPASGMGCECAFPVAGQPSKREILDVY